MLPAVTGSVLSDLVIERSAAVLTTVASVAEWSPGVGSVVVEVTEAVFERSARRLGSTLTTMCRTVVPAGRSPRFQVTVPATFEPLLSPQPQLFTLFPYTTLFRSRANEGPPLVTVIV